MRLGLAWIVFVLLGILMLMLFLELVYTEFSPHDNLRQIKSKKHQTLVRQRNISHKEIEPLRSISKVKTAVDLPSNDANKLPDANLDIQLNTDVARKDDVGGKNDSVKDNEDFMKMMGERMKKRREMVEVACHRLVGLFCGSQIMESRPSVERGIEFGPPWSINLNNRKMHGISSENNGVIQIIHAKKYKLAYCVVPKTGCSNMKRVMLALNGYSNNSADIFPKNVFLNTNKLHEEAKKFLVSSRGMPDFVTKDNFIKFVVVRHPFERALSAYRNKLTKQWNMEKPQFYKRSEFIRKTYGKGGRRNATDEAPTFEEFVDYLYDANNTNLNGEDSHWNSISVVCYPCQNNFDVIGTIDTIDEDLRYLMMLIGAPDLSMPAGYSKSGRSNTDKEALESTFGSLPKEKIDNLYEVYKSDFMMFGYDKPSLNV